jgi:restriction system protein
MEETKAMTSEPRDDPPFQPIAGSGSDLAALVAHWRRLKSAPAVQAAAVQLGLHVSEPIVVGEEVHVVITSPPIVLPVGISLVERGDTTAEGHLITGVTIAWWAIIKELERNPEFQLHTIGSRAFEELLAGAYEREGWKVILTPRSGDLGRDVIATLSGIAGSIRIIDQAKAYKPGLIVEANDVRAMTGVLLASPDVTKAFVTTTSRFAPGVSTDAILKPLMPFKLELRDGARTREWLLANPPSS